MKALSLKVNTYKTSVNIVNNYNLERRVFNIMLGMLGVLVLCYVIFLGNTVFNIVERQSLSKESRILSNEVGELELQYLSASSKIDVSLATSLGFKESQTKQYTTRKSLGSIKLAKNDL
ncbi:MAG: hypothetical protein WCO07_00315 [bacterium]